MTAIYTRYVVASSDVSPKFWPSYADIKAARAKARRWHYSGIKGVSICEVDYKGNATPIEHWKDK